MRKTRREWSSEPFQALSLLRLLEAFAGWFLVFSHGSMIVLDSQQRLEARALRLHTHCTHMHSVNTRMLAMSVNCRRSRL